jgi:hypothetical protein
MSCSWRFLFNLPLWHRGSPDRLCSLSAPVVADQQLFRSFPARRGGFGGHYYCGLVRSSCFFGFRCYSVSDSNGIAGGVVRILESGPIARSLDPPVINKHIRTSYIREREGEREICGEQPALVDRDWEEMEEAPRPKRCSCGPSYVARTVGPPQLQL